MPGTAQMTASASMVSPSVTTPVAAPSATTILRTGVETRIASEQAAASAALKDPMPRSGMYTVPLLSIVSPMYARISAWPAGSGSPRTILSGPSSVNRRLLGTPSRFR